VARELRVRIIITKIDGLDIHFIHVRSKHEDALPLIVTHGRRGSIVEQLKIIDRLTDPTAHGASALDAFHVVIPSMPGYGFSGRPTTPGWGPDHIARACLAMISRSFVDGVEGSLTRDDVLDNLTLFWLTSTAISAARLYRENKFTFVAAKGVSVPGGRERLP
jgi:hypothetical protein